MSPCQYHEFLSIPWVLVNIRSPCQYHEPMSKGTLRSNVSKRYLKVQCTQKVPKGPDCWGDKETHKHTDRQTHQYHDSAWPKGRAEWKSRARETRNLLTDANSITFPRNPPPPLVTKPHEKIPTPWVPDSATESAYGPIQSK